MSVFGARLKQARLRAGLSQEQLGIEAGLDPMSASARMNRYELGLRVPNFDLVEALAKVLRVPTPYFYSRDEHLARLILAYGSLKALDRLKVVETVERQASTRKSGTR
jgi:transcriptional regulator with XRE-family HTH domain